MGDTQLLPGFFTSQSFMGQWQRQATVKENSINYKLQGPVEGFLV